MAEASPDPIRNCRQQRVISRQIPSALQDVQYALCCCARNRSHAHKNRLNVVMNLAEQSARNNLQT